MLTGGPGLSDAHVASTCCSAFIRFICASSSSPLSWRTCSLRTEQHTLARVSGSRAVEQVEAGSGLQHVV